MKTKYFFLLLFILTISSFNKKANAQNNDTEILTFVEGMPTYIGGETARINFINKHIKYPKEARKNNIEGPVYVSFIIEKDGSITNINLIRDIGGGCGEEAMRVVKLMPKWNPGKQNGEFVRVQFMLPFKFKLSD